MDLATRWSSLFTGMSPASFINFSFLPKYGVYFLQALGYTLLLAVVSVALAVLPALLLAFMRLSKNRLVRAVSGAYIAVFRSTPLLVQLSIIYFMPSVEQMDDSLTMVTTSLPSAGRTFFTACGSTTSFIYFKDVALNGKKVNLDLHRREMGMVFQHFNLFPNMTVKKNIRSG